MVNTPQSVDVSLLLFGGVFRPLNDLISFENMRYPAPNRRSNKSFADELRTAMCLVLFSLLIDGMWESMLLRSVIWFIPSPLAERVLICLGWAILGVLCSFSSFWRSVRYLVIKIITFLKMLRPLFEVLDPGNSSPWQGRRDKNFKEGMW